MSLSQASGNSRIKVVLFDFMGTCLDWHTSIVNALPLSIAEETRSKLALEWRHTYFDYNTARLNAGKLPEDFDTTVRNVLTTLLEKYPDAARYFTNETRENAINAWHKQQAWPDVRPAIEKLKERGYEVFVHANGTTRLQLDIVRSSGLSFDMLFSSELLGHYKPAPENYHKALSLIKRGPEECVTVAAHTSDLKGAKAVGMKTLYIRRWTDDISEDQQIIRKENDAYLEDMSTLVETIAAL